METWKPIPSWRGLYEVSDQGQVRSLTRTRVQKLNVPIKHTYHGKVLAQATIKGYRVATLSAPERRTQEYVHRLVLLAFVGKPKENQEVCHYNGNKQDNRLINLRWDTRRANQADKFRQGRQPVGTQHPNAKLTENLVRELRAGDMSSHEFSRKHGIHVMTISKARRGLTWKHVK